MLDHLVDEVDGVDHVALALVAVDRDGVGVPAGVARMIRYRDRPTAADVAVTVFDEWQGRGVATALLDELLRQRPAGRHHGRHHRGRRQRRLAGDAPPDG